MKQPSHNTVNKTVGQRIRDIRKELGLSQRMLAVRIGTSIPAISKLESGFTDANLSRLEQIAVALDVDILMLFGGQRSHHISNAVDSAQCKLASRDEEITVLQRKAIHLYEELRKK